jgi:hypothetical protein
MTFLLSAVEKINAYIIIVKFHLVIVSNCHFCILNASVTLEMVQLAVPSQKSKMSKNVIFCVCGVGGFRIFNPKQWIYEILG